MKRLSKWFTRVERVTLWIGAMSGIVATILIVRNQIMTPTPPDLRVNFALTGTSLLAVARQNRKHVETFPLDLLVTNEGRLTAQKVRLKLVDSKVTEPSYYSHLTIETNKEDFTQNSIHVGEITREMTTISLGEIHPGETVFLESVLRAKLLTNHAPVLLPFPSDVNSPVSSGLPAVPLKNHEIEVRISAENLPEKKVSLYITIGMAEQLKKEEELLFVPLDGNLILYK